MAAWAKVEGEDETRTIYATERASKNEWIGVDSRPSSVPVWFGVRESDTEEFGVDAISGATPGGKTLTINWSVPEDWIGKRIEIFLEGNVGFDYNGAYPKDAPEGSPGFSGVNGQPSLIWKALLDTSLADQGQVPMKAVGHGSATGEDHEIVEDLSTMTTAKDLFLHLDARFVPATRP